MNIILSNGTTLSPILVTGGPRYVQGQSRDTLSFIFPATESLEELDSLFTPENCETITVVDEQDAEYIHSAYTVRAELKKEAVEVTPATEEAEAVYEDRITVSMSQRTYTESQLASLTDTVDVLVMESLMG